MQDGSRRPRFWWIVLIAVGHELSDASRLVAQDFAPGVHLKPYVFAKHSQYFFALDSSRCCTLRRQRVLGVRYTATLRVLFPGRKIITLHNGDNPKPGSWEELNQFSDERLASE